MLERTYPANVKLVFGFLYTDGGVYKKVRSLLVDQFGPVDFESDRIPFTYTDYYTSEMGPQIYRRFIGHQYLIDSHSGLIKAKLAAIEIEKRYAVNGKRRINIDPGYMSMAKFVLSSTKDYSHRIYLGKGLFAEITLGYSRKEGFVSHPWTYPDYKSPEYQKIMLQLRDIYNLQLKDEAEYQDE